ncbi:MAG: AraC family transcriptional regulator [Oscillospiraceae bacterium]|nr:AraC family transcriptional regulator [Oscillospiraceae bacterium]
MDTNSNPSQEKIDAVTRMQHYISEHIQEPITQYKLAQAAGYSEYYAARIFKELTGKPPFEYIRRLRLSQSAIVLRNGKAKIIDVAFDYVFDSHEGFTRAFTKEFGISPKEYSNNPKPLRLFMPSNLNDFYLLKNNRNEGKLMSQTSNAIFVQIVDRPARKVIMKRGKTATHYFEFCEEVGCDIWGILCGIKGALYEPVGMWMPKNLRPEGTSFYTQGVEVPLDWQGEIPKGFETIELPPCKMLIFQGASYEDEKFNEAINDLWKQTENYNPEIYGFTWDDEIAPKFQLAPMGYRGYIEGRPVKELNK